MEDQARVMAERIARRVATSSASPPSRSTDISAELAAMRTSLNELQNRLIQIESKISGEEQVSAPPRMHSPWHPSLERFGVEEATVSELVDFFQNEKQCSVEPGGKPCDHCAMCSSRGF
jgi:CRISPR/Cas system-associated protein Cas10 (large subunit of type III CRISPR-Cas system)